MMYDAYFFFLLIDLNILYIIFYFIKHPHKKIFYIKTLNNTMTRKRNNDIALYGFLV